MNRFWKRYIHPLIETTAPRRVMEIGADAGWNTRNLLAYCHLSGAHLDIIDPAPQPSLHDVLAGYDEEYTYYPLRSVEAIPSIESPDIALIDGDHNWTTVYRELELIFASAADHGREPPIIISHDVAWPYARRDMYYNPDDLSDAERHPYAYVGILPGVNELVEQGMNGVLANAAHEGGPRNGVLTAIEDFIASSSVKITFYKLPFFNGLGILVPDSRLTTELRALIDGFYTVDSLLESCVEIDLDGMRLRAILSQTETALTKRTEALSRARGLISELAAENRTLKALNSVNDTGKSVAKV